MSEQLALAEMDSVETVMDGLTYQSSKPDERGKIEVFAEDVWFLIRYINTLRADALLASEKAVKEAITAANDFDDLRARLSRLSALLDEAEAALGVFARGSEQGIQYVSHIWTGARPAPIVQSDLKRAASVSAKIAKEKSE